MTAQLLMFPDARQPCADELALSFELWWRQYPHRVAKGQARRAWAAAIRKADFATLLAGVERYKAAKPADIAWCNPATWLNGERWLDEPADNCRKPPETCGISSHHTDLELKLRAKTIAAGLPCPNATRQQVERMLKLGWLTADQAKRAGY